MLKFLFYINYKIQFIYIWNINKKHFQNIQNNLNKYIFNIYILGFYSNYQIQFTDK